MWDLNTGQVVSIFEGRGVALCCLSACVASTLVAGDRAGNVWLWDLSTLDARQLASLAQPVCSVYLTQDGARAIAVDETGTVTITGVNGDAQLRSLQCGGPVGSVIGLGGKPVAWLADDKRVLVGLKSGCIEVWNYAEDTREAMLQGHAEEVASIAVSRDGKLAASSANPELAAAFLGRDDDDIRIWDLDSYQLVQSLDNSSGQCFGMAFRGETYSLITAHMRYGLLVWDLETGTPLQLPLPPTIISRVTLSFDGRYALTAAATDEYLVRVWDLDLCRLVSVLYGHGLNVSVIRITEDGHRVVTGSADKTIRVWNTDRLEPHGARAGHAGPITALYAFPERDLVCSGSMDDTLRAWSLTTGLQLDFYERPQLNTGTIARLNSSLFITGSVHGSIEVWPFPAFFKSALDPRRLPIEVFVPSGLVCVPTLKRIVVTSYHESDIFMWEMSADGELPPFKGHKDDINSIVMTSDERFLVTTSNDKTLRVWEIKSGRCMHVLSGHDCAVRGVAVSPDDHRIVSSGADGSLIIWDLENGTQLGRVDGNGVIIYSLSITPDGTYIVTGDARGWLLFWTLDLTPNLAGSVQLDSEIEFVHALQGSVIAGNASGSLYCLEYR